MGLPEAALKFFADYVEKELGIVYAPHVYFQLEQRLERVAQYLGLAGSDAVYKKAKEEGISGDFKQYLLDISTNNETSFFRDSKVFQAIEKTILPSLAKEFPTAFRHRIWCAAASFGQEPYSLAMLAKEFQEKNPGSPMIEITATDISDQALKRCRDGKYTQLEVQRGLPAARLVRYFLQADEMQWVLKPEIRSLVEFKRQNLLDPFTGLGVFHLVSCRYVLIYQDVERKKEIVEKIVQSLVPGGYLVLGASETAMGLSSKLTQVVVDGSVFYRKNG